MCFTIKDLRRKEDGQESTFDSNRIERHLLNVKCLFVQLRGCVYLRFSPFLMGSGQIKEAEPRASGLSQCGLTRDLCRFIQTRFMLFTGNYYSHTLPVQVQPISRRRIQTRVIPCEGETAGSAYRPSAINQITEKIWAPVKQFKSTRTVNYFKNAKKEIAIALFWYHDPDANM